MIAFGLVVGMVAATLVAVGVSAPAVAASDASPFGSPSTIADHRGLGDAVGTPAPAAPAADAPRFRIPASIVTGPPPPPGVLVTNGCAETCAGSPTYTFSIPSGGASLTLAGSSDGATPWGLHGSLAGGAFLDGDPVVSVAAGCGGGWAGVTGTTVAVGGGLHQIQLGWDATTCSTFPSARDLWVIGATLVSVGPGGVGGSPYVALGDSFSSGEGDPPFIPPSDTDGCDRSRAAYSQLLSAFTWRFNACSGATIHALETGINGEQSQYTGLGPATQLVTLTIGGEDIGLADVIRDCVWTGWSATGDHGPTVQNAFGAVGAPGCKDRQAWNLALGLAAIQSSPPTESSVWRLRDLYLRIHSKAPNAAVRVSTYPPRFPDSVATAGAGVDCRVGSWSIWGASAWISKSDAEWLAAVGHYLNGVITQEVNAAKTASPTFDIEVVDAHEPGFVGHDMCIESGNGGDRYFTDALTNGSFHPTATGQFVMALALYWSL